MLKLSLLGKAMLDFTWMSTSQIAALIVAIIFSVCSVATSILAFKYAKKFNTFLKSVAITMVAPFLAVASWLFLILSFLDAFRNDEALNIVISILIALFLCGVVIVVSKALYAKNGEKMEMNDTDDAIEGTFEDQSNALPATNNPLLLEDEKQAEEAPEEEQTEEAEELDKSVAAYADAEEIEEQPEEAAEEIEEQPEEAAEEVEETPVEEVADETPVEEEQAEEVTEETPVEEESAEEVTEETPVKETEEVYSVDEDENEESEEDEEDEEDEEFKKFIEALRERNRMRTSDKPEGDDNN